MTVTYSLECSTTKFSTFFKLLLRWRGSVYKLVWAELVMFLIFYYALSVLYRFGLNDIQRETFEKLSIFCERSTNYIVLFFFLGFYVSQVVDRWWRMYCSIPWPDRFALQVAIFVEGDDDRGRLLRRTLVRYINAASVITLRNISAAVKKRFPTMQHLVDAGFLTVDECKNIENGNISGCLYWIPIQWATALLYKLKDERRIRMDFVNQLIQDCLDIRGKLGTLLDFDWISIPLVYTQAVTIAVYAYFLVCLMGRQYLNPHKQLPNNEIDLFIPWITILQFVFYMGWLKVAETLMNPFGEDDDDFELNYIIERNVRIAYLQVTERYNDLPPLQRDIYWKDREATLPHTVASLNLKDNEFAGSAAEVEVSPEEAETLSPEEVQERKNTPQNPILKAFSRQISGSNILSGGRKMTPSASEMFARRRLGSSSSEKSLHSRITEEGSQHGSEDAEGGGSFDPQRSPRPRIETGLTRFLRKLGRPIPPQELEKSQTIIPVVAPKAADHCNEKKIDDGNTDYVSFDVSCSPSIRRTSARSSAGSNAETKQFPAGAMGAAYLTTLTVPQDGGAAQSGQPGYDGRAAEAADTGGGEAAGGVGCQTGGGGGNVYGSDQQPNN